MLKKVLLILTVVGAAAYLFRKVKNANDERALWHEATTSPDLR
jgi:hypothetical protein